MDGLVGSSFAPITESIGFVGADASVVAETLADGASGFHVAPRIDHLDGALADGFAALSPMGDHSPDKYLVVNTRSRWSAVFGNSLHPTSDAVRRLSATLRCPGLFFRHLPDAHRLPGGRYGITQFAIFPEGGADASGKPLREIYVANDGGRWVFSADGEVQPFELLDRYDAKRIRDRLTPEMLAAHGQALGIDIHSEDFYRMPGYVVSERGGKVWQLIGRVSRGPTLETVRRRYGLEFAKSVDQVRLLRFDADDLEGLLQQRVEPGGR